MSPELLADFFYISLLLYFILFQFGLLDFALSKRFVLAMFLNPTYQYILSWPYSYLHPLIEKVLNKISIGYQSGFTPFHRLLQSTFMTLVNCFKMTPLIPLIKTSKSCPFVSKACFPKILIDDILHIIFLENLTVQCNLPLLNYYLSFSMFNLSPSAPAGSVPKPDVEPYTQFRWGFYVHGCLHTLSCTYVQLFPLPLSCV